MIFRKGKRKKKVGEEGKREKEKYKERKEKCMGFLKNKKFMDFYQKKKGKVYGL